MEKDPELIKPYEVIQLKAVNKIIYFEVNSLDKI
jgi:hypothetical protein